MLETFGRTKETEFDDAIERILFTMNEHEVGSPEYAKAVVFLDRVTDVRQKGKSNAVSRDTMIIAGAAILQTLLIVFAEQHHVVVSKGLSFVLKPKTQSITI